MSLLSKIGITRGGRLERTRIGAADVVHVDPEITVEARAVVAALPEDPGCALVVADLPCSAPVEVWKAFAAALPRGRRPVRVVPGRPPREVAPYVWQWLADRTGRAVVAPFGIVHLAPGGLFVHSGDQSGWGLFRKGATPASQGRRFPRPGWDVPALGRVRSVAGRVVAEPLPTGIWLRPDAPEGVLTEARARLIATMPGVPDAPTIVLGAPAVGKVWVSDVASFWRTLPMEIAAAARFVRYDARVVADLDGQDLADAVGAEVCCYTGVLRGSPAAPDVVTANTGNSLGWRTFARALTFRPGGGGVGRIAIHRPPVPGLGEVGPGIYAFAPGVVLEVVAAGLWLRPAETLTDPAGVRTTPLDPDRALLVYEASDDVNTRRLRELAEGLVGHLDDMTRRVTWVRPSTALTGTPRAKRPAAESAATAPAVLAAPVPPPAEPTPPVASAQVAVTSIASVLSPSDRPAPLPQPRDPRPARLAEDDEPDTNLPWLSQLMETMVLPTLGGRPGGEWRDDRADR